MHFLYYQINIDCVILVHCDNQLHQATVYIVIGLRVCDHIPQRRKGKQKPEDRMSRYSGASLFLQIIYPKYMTTCFVRCEQELVI